MPPCYTFDKLCIQNSGMDRCQTSGETVCPVAWWFWITAAIVGVVVVAGGK